MRPKTAAVTAMENAAPNIANPPLGILQNVNQLVTTMCTDCMNLKPAMAWIFTTAGAEWALNTLLRPGFSPKQF